jgi:dTMP kinase
MERPLKSEMKMKRGTLIVIDGIDGTGKTTQAKKLLESLNKKGFEAVYFREPSDSSWGLEIKRKASRPDSLSPEEELDLFQKDRIENVEKNLKPALGAKKIVVLDRYYFSTMAYQGARGIDPEMIKALNESFAIKPDLVFILDVVPSEGLSRIRKSRDSLEEHFEREDYLAKVREIFLSIEGENIHHIDASRPESEISGDIGKIVFDFLGDAP